MTRSRHRQTGTGPWSAVWVAAAVVCVVGVGVVNAEAATPIEDADGLQELCELGDSEVETDDSQQRQEFHERRRQAIHDVFEIELSELDGDVVDYDRVSGLLTISGFRHYRPFDGGPALRFRNGTILSFEFDEQRAHDLMAQMRMGTVTLRVGVAAIAHGDYDTDFCPAVDDDPGRRLDVDLLYARIVDTESSVDDGGEVLATYQTRFGHQWALRNESALIDAVGLGVPQVEISHFQWRPTGQSWGDEFDDEERPDGLDDVESELRTEVERILYPCYLQALSTNASLQGAIVVEIPCQSGVDIEARFLMDTIREYPIRHCFQERLDRLDALTEAIDIDAVDALKATILLRRN